MTYTGPTLESLDGDLDQITMAALGDSVRYMPEGGAFSALRGYVDFGEALRDIETGKVIEQDITVQLLISDAPDRPNGRCRIRIIRLPDLTFKPVNVRTNRSGTHWEFEVARTDD